MTTKSLSCTQIIIPIDSDNIKKIMVLSGEHIANLNYALKSIKSDIFINFICSNHRSLIIIANKVASLSDLSIVEKYLKSAKSMNSNDVQSACLLTSTKTLINHCFNIKGYICYSSKTLE